MFFGSLAVAAYFFHKTSQKHQKNNKPKKDQSLNLASELKLESPFEIIPAIKIRAIYVVDLLALAIGQKYLGSSGVYAAAFFSGFVDVDAIVLSSLESVKLGEMESSLAEEAIIIAIMINNAVKILYVAILGNRKLIGKVSIGISFTMLCGFIAMLLF